jgi:hypothetical protein
MKLRDFKIGTEFTSVSGSTFQTTDVGSRTVVAIRIDQLEVASTDNFGKTVNAKTVSREEAETRHLFDGPPYGVPELVFDEDELDEPVAPRHLRVVKG